MNDNWRTPKELYNLFINNGYKDLFPYNDNPNYNELDNIYYKDKLFINPPYSIINKKVFKKWLYIQIKHENDIFLLIPSKTDTELFEMLFNVSFEIIFITGRLKFNDSSNTAPFPSCIFHINEILSIKSDFSFELPLVYLIKNKYLKETLKNKLMEEEI